MSFDIRKIDEGGPLGYLLDMWLPETEQQIKDWIPKAKGNFYELFQIHGYCTRASAPREIIDQLWIELISASDSLEKLRIIDCILLTDDHNDELFQKIDSLCQTLADTDFIKSLSSEKSRLFQRLSLKRDQLVNTPAS